MENAVRSRYVFPPSHFTEEGQGPDVLGDSGHNPAASHLALTAEALPRGRLGPKLQAEAAV